MAYKPVCVTLRQGFRLKNHQYGPPLLEAWLGYAVSRGNYHHGFERAKENGYSEAGERILESLYNIGEEYRAGCNVPQDYEEALKWFNRAKENGYLKAEEGIARVSCTWVLIIIKRKIFQKL